MRTLPLQRVHLLRIIIRVSFDVSNNSSLPDAAAIVMKRDTVFEEVGSPWRVVMYWRRFRIYKTCLTRSGHARERRGQLATRVARVLPGMGRVMRRGSGANAVRRSQLVASPSW